jgi:hypothetical protein
MILCCAVIQGALYPEVFNLSWKVWFSAIMMPLLAWSVGFFLPILFRQDLAQRTAIAFEVSAQNMALAITIVAVAYDDAEDASYYSQFIILYGSFQIAFGVALSLIFNFVFRYKERRTLCHQFSRSRNRQSSSPGLQSVSTNGTTMTQLDSPEEPVRYTGSSLDLTVMGSDMSAKVNSTTQLVEMDGIQNQQPVGATNDTDTRENGKVSVIVGDE